MKANLLLAGISILWMADGVFAQAPDQNNTLSYLQARRAAALKKYDKDGDGKLNEAEREAMRKAVAAQRLQAARRGFAAMMLPPEIVKKYDKDGDGTLDDEESQAAREGIRKQFEEVKKKYDKNGDGNLDPSEQEAMQKDAEAGKIEGMPRFFAGPRPPGVGRPSGPSREEIIQRMDQNRDGRLSAEELQFVRAELAKLRAEQSKKEPAEKGTSK